jgi:hypothetical protein
VEGEGGLTLLEELINSNVVNVGDRGVGAAHSAPYPRVIELASIVRENVTRWKEREAEDENGAGGAGGGGEPLSQLALDG